MSLLVGTRRALLRKDQSYRAKVLATGPIAYWMQGETAGSVAYCQISGAQNGAYTGVTLGQSGIGDGRTSPLYDGANDYTDVQSAALAAVFSSAVGSVMIWARVANVGVWTDGTTDAAFRLEADGDNFVYLLKTSNNNQFRFTFRAGAISESSNIALSTTDWFNVIMTWDKVANQVLQYLNGVEVATDDYAGVWVGTPALSLIGALTAVPTSPWNGWLSHCAVWNRALSPAEGASVGVL